MKNKSKLISLCLLLLATVNTAWAQTATDVACAAPCISTAEISNNAITPTKIQNAAVTAAKLATNSVATTNIIDGTIANTDIASGAAIDPSKISGTAWTSTNDGTGTGLDADTIDGINSTTFLRSDQAANFTSSVTTTGNMGIGTESPNNSLHVVGGGYFNAAGTYVPGGTLVDWDGLHLEHDDAINTSNPIGLDLAISRAAPTIAVRNNTGPALLVEAGNVGIGTTTPTEKLDVAGNIKLSGNIVSDGDICIGSCE